MTERQRALLAYVATVADQVRGFRTVYDLRRRVLDAIEEDLTFLAANIGKAVASSAIHAAGDQLASRVGNFLSNLGRR